MYVRGYRHSVLYPSTPSLTPILPVLPITVTHITIGRRNLVVLFPSILLKPVIALFSFPVLLPVKDRVHTNSPPQVQIRRHVLSTIHLSRIILVILDDTCIE